MSSPDKTALTHQSHAGLRQNAARIAGGVAGATAMAALAVGSVAPLMTAGAGVAMPAVIQWVAGLGGNALANWIDTWAQKNLARFDGQDPDAEQHLFAALAHDLQQHLDQNTVLADDVARLVQLNGAIVVTIDALKNESYRQAALLQTLIDDTQYGRVRNDQLHALTVQAVEEHTRNLLNAQAQRDLVLTTQLQRILDAAEKMRKSGVQQTINNQASNQGAQGVFHDRVIFNQPGNGGMTISGGVENVQQVTVSGGSVGSIIGRQTNYGNTGASAPALSQDEIDEYRDLLTSQRGLLATYLRQAQRGNAEGTQRAQETRTEIQRLKDQFRAWGVSVTDEPGDIA